MRDRMRQVGRGSNRGTALLLSIAMTMLLFILGLAFVFKSQSQSGTVEDLDNSNALRIGVQSVLDQISNVLVEDLFDENGNFLAGDGMATGTIATGNDFDAGEAFDYPSHFVNPGYDGILGSKDDLVFSQGTDGDYDLISGSERRIYNDNADPWLASLEPSMVDVADDPISNADNVRGFAHISDIYGRLAEQFHNSYLNERENNTGRIASANPTLNFQDAEGDRISFRNLRAWVVDPVAPIVEGNKADADGDGVSDSRWVPIPGLSGPDNETYYAAVRIVDTCGMINVNTASRAPLHSSIFTYMNNSSLGDWDGSRLSHVNLEGILAYTDGDGVFTDNSLDIRHLMSLRFGDYQGTNLSIANAPMNYRLLDEDQSDVFYEEFAARRMLNPFVFRPNSNTSYAFSPFDLADEMNLRHRFFLSSDFRGRLGSASLVTWPVTFSPGNGRVGKTLPHRVNRNDIGDLVNESGDTLGLNEQSERLDVQEWYHKLKPDYDQQVDKQDKIGFYNRRFISTTYSFDRIVAPYPPGNPDFSGSVSIGPDTMPNDLRDAWNDWNRWNRPVEQRLYRPVPVNETVNATHPDLPPSTNERIALLAAAIWLGLPDDATLTAAGEHPSLTQFANQNWSGTLRDHLARQFAVNAFDFIDADDVPSLYELTPGTPTDGAYIGFEELDDASYLYFGLVAMSVGNNDNGTTGTVDDDWVEERYAVQIYNHGPAAVSDLGDWILNHESSEFRLPSGVPLAVGSSLILYQSGSGSGFQPGDFSAVNARSFSSLPDLQDDDVLILLEDSPTLGDGVQRPTDKIVIGSLPELPNNAEELRDGTWSEDPGKIVQPGEKVVVVSQSRTGNRIRLSTGDLLALNYDPIDVDQFLGVNSTTLFDREYSTLLPSSMAPIGVYSRNNILRSVGEIFQIPYIAFMILPGNEPVSFNESWYDALANPSVPATADIERGRLDPAYYDAGNLNDPTDDQSFYGLMRYLTVFAPFMDSADNDGNGRSDDPANDGEDNDGDGSPDGTDPEGNEIDFAEQTEYRMAGRVNINTAPWFVINQLPWIQDPCFAWNAFGTKDVQGTTVSFENIALARNIVAFRDKIWMQGRGSGIMDYRSREGLGDTTWDTFRAQGFSPSQTRQYVMGLRSSTDRPVRETPGFSNITELLNVTFFADQNDASSTWFLSSSDELYGTGSQRYNRWYDIRRLGRDESLAGGSAWNNNDDLETYAHPMYGMTDNMTNDILERDVIFQRISNVATVRSDTFAAYILVRLGEAGPEKRVVAIFDRADVTQITDKPRIVAMQVISDS